MDIWKGGVRPAAKRFKLKDGCGDEMLINGIEEEGRLIPSSGSDGDTLKGPRSGWLRR